MLVAVLAFEVLTAARLDWPWWLNTLAIVALVVGLGGGYVVLNLVRGRPWATPPQDVGPAELAFFAFAPGTLVLLTGWQWQAALSLVAFNLLVLGFILLVVRYGFGATLWWGGGRVFVELGDSLLRLIRFLPLLLIFSMALFTSSEVWQLFNRSPSVADAVLVGFFAALIVLILRIRLRSETRQIVERAEQAVPGAAGLPTLSHGQRVNIAVMVGSSQLLQVIVISAGVGVFFLTVGVLTINTDLLQTWQIHDPGWYRMIGVEGMIITQTHVRVAFALAMFTGLYYAVSVLTDALYREDFIEDMSAKMATVNTYRVRYHRLLNAETTADGETGHGETAHGEAADGDTAGLAPPGDS